MLTGKSFELILAVAAVEGKLRTFVTKLLKFNECSKQIGGEGGKASQTRAMLFDVTFLMLCSIVHTYGPEVSWLPSKCVCLVFMVWNLFVPFCLKISSNNLL